MAERAWLDVSFEEKDLAKAAGARWDRDARRWYAPRPGMAALARWAPRPDLPDVLPGEDRSFGAGLYCDMIPSTAWATNVRAVVDPGEWDRLRTMIYRRAGQRCEACGLGRDDAAGRYLEAHERWTYQRHQPTGRLVQRLVRLIALCTWCHEVTHWGRTQNIGRGEAALSHLCRVNRWTRDQALAHAEAALQLWSRRSEYLWELDVSILAAAGITLAAPPAAAERPAAAAAAIRDLAQPPPPPRDLPEPREHDDAPAPGVSVRAVTFNEIGTGNDPLSRLLRGERPELPGRA